MLCVYLCALSPLLPGYFVPFSSSSLLFPPSPFLCLKQRCIRFSFPLMFLTRVHPRIVAAGKSFLKGGKKRKRSGGSALALEPGKNGTKQRVTPKNGCHCAADYRPHDCDCGSWGSYFWSKVLSLMTKNGSVKCLSDNLCLSPRYQP